MLPFSSSFKSIVFLLTFILLPSSCVCSLDDSLVPSPHPPTPFCSSGPPRSIALVGNPGTGKSTILNGLVARPAFQSGPSIGVGLTKHLQSVSLGKVNFYDTPGLSDVQSRTEAAAEIDKLLAVDGPLTLVFVVTLQNGRVRVEDATTIETILNAIDANSNDRFGLLVNQISRDELVELQSGSAHAHRLRRMLTGSRYTTFWHFIPIDEALLDVENGLLESPALKSFIERLPETRAVGAALNKVDVEGYDEKLDALKRSLAEEEQEVVEQIKQKLRNTFFNWTVITNIPLLLLPFISFGLLGRLIMLFIKMIMRNWSPAQHNKVFRITVLQCRAPQVVHCAGQDCRKCEDRREVREREKAENENILESRHLLPQK